MRYLFILSILLSYSLWAAEDTQAKNGQDNQAICRASVDAAKKMIEIKQAEAAKTLLDAALKAVPNDVEALILRARIRLNENDLAGASADAEEGRKSLYRKGSSNWTKMESELFNESGTIIDRSDVINKAKKEIEAIKTNLRKMGNETSDEVWKKKIITFADGISYPKEETTTKTAQITTPTKKEEAKTIPSVDPIVGKWKWPNKFITTFNKNGTMVCSNGFLGRWIKEESNYVLIWSGGTDVVTIEDDEMKWVGSKMSSNKIKE